jgi:galactokinase
MPTLSSIETLHMSLAAMQAVSSEYVQRAQHAEQAAGILMQDKLPQELLRQLTLAMVEQMNQRGKERAVQQQAVLQATLIALTAATKRDDANMRQEVEHVIKELTRALSVMNDTQPRRVNNNVAANQSTTTGAQ